MQGKDIMYKIKYNLFATDRLKKAVEDLETKKLSTSYGKLAY